MSTLSQGCSGADVISLQNALRARGFNPGPSTGDFGQDTLAAVIDFQKAKGLKPDGVVGPITAAALGLDKPAAPVTTSIPGVTVDAVCKMFPVTPRANIEKHLPVVCDGLVAASLTDKPMVLMALATIRAETEGFRPISEGQSSGNTTAGGQPFDKYDHNKDLGNQGPPDGERFRGRGFVQLTGRHNYTVHGRAIGRPDLVDNPDLANDPVIASQLLASFLKASQAAIQKALAAGDLKEARRLVNGGSNGLDRFEDAFNRGMTAIPDAASATA